MCKKKPQPGTGAASEKSKWSLKSVTSFVKNKMKWKKLPDELEIVASIWDKVAGGWQNRDELGKVINEPENFKDKELQLFPKKSAMRQEKSPPELKSDQLEKFPSARSEAEQSPTNWENPRRLKRYMTLQ